MKKSAILSIALMSVLLLTGCKKNKNSNKKGDVVNDLLLKANTKEERKYIYSSYNLTQNEILLENIADIDYSSGFLIITTEDTRKTFYSVTTNKFLESDLLISDYVAYSSNVTGGFLKLTLDGLTTIYDALGNTLVDHSYESYSLLKINSGIDTKGRDYCDIISGTGETERHQYFIYENGKPTLLKVLDNEDQYGTGSSMQGVEYVSLDDYGHKGYTRYKNSGRYVVFDDNNIEIASFTDPVADTKFFVGDYLIYQNSVRLDENNDEYDYIDSNGVRYSLETCRINYLNAKKEEISVNYVFQGDESVFSLRNEDGIYEYCYADVKTISSKKILSNTIEKYIIDGGATLHDNVTGIYISAFERFGENYYDPISKTIYDGNLNEISILTNMAPVRINNADIIVCVRNGKYGAINSEGKVVFEFKFDKIYTDYISGNRLLAVYNDTLGVYQFNAKNCEVGRLRYFEGYSTATYLKHAQVAGIDGGIYYVTDKDDSTKNYYFSFFDSELRDYLMEDGENLVVKISTARNIDQSTLVVLQEIYGVYELKTARITISH